MNWIKGIIAKVIGKQINTDEWGISKAKVTAILGVILVGVQTIPPAFGHPPIVIPDYVYKLLAAAGLWTLRSALPDGKAPS